MLRKGALGKSGDYKSYIVREGLRALYCYVLSPVAFLRWLAVEVGGSVIYKKLWVEEDPESSRVLGR